MAKKKVKEVNPDELRLDNIFESNKNFTAEIMSEDSNDYNFPYRIPFKHHCLQAISGGIIGGTMAEISGDSQTGKSFLLYELIANTIEMGGHAQLFDLERALEKAYAKIAGIDLSGARFAIEYSASLPDFFSKSTNFIKTIRDKQIEKKLPTNTPILIGVDSFPGLQHAVDLANMEAGKDPRGYAAMQKNAYFSQQIDKFVQYLKDKDATLVLLNQTRINYAIEFGDKTSTPAENTIKFWCTQRIRGSLSKKIVKKVPSIEYKDGVKTIIGSTVKWSTIKNRSVKPFQIAMLKFRYASGVDQYSGLDEYLYGLGKIKLATTTKTKEGETIKKPIKGFKLIGDADEKFYYSIKELVDEKPELLEPIWTGTYDDGEGEAEDDGKESGEEKE